MSKDFMSYSTYQPTEENAPNESTVKVQVHDGASRVTFKDGNAIHEHEGHSKFSAMDINDYPSEDWKSTARTVSGTPCGYIDDDVLVTISGVQATVGTFLANGFLVKAGDGKHYLPSELPQQYQPKADPEEASRIAEKQRHQAVLPDGMGEAVNSAIGNISDERLDTITMLGIAAASGDIDMETVVRHYGQATGYDDASKRVGFVIDVYTAQVDHYLTTQQGLAKNDLEGFYEWARQPENKSALTKALNDQILTRRMESWGKLAEAFFMDIPPTQEALDNAGFETMARQDGALMVKLKGQWMSVEAAAKMQLI